MVYSSFLDLNKTSTGLLVTINKVSLRNDRVLLTSGKEMDIDDLVGNVYNCFYKLSNPSKLKDWLGFKDKFGLLPTMVSGSELDKKK